MKRKAFKELLSAVRGARPKGRRPSLRLVVSKPLLSVVDAEAAGQPSPLTVRKRTTSISAPVSANDLVRRDEARSALTGSSEIFPLPEEQ